MEGIMKIQMISYLKQLQEIQMEMAKNGKGSQIWTSFDERGELWTISFTIHQPTCEIITLYVWSDKYYTHKDYIDNERKLAELRNRFVKKALMVVA